VRQAWSTTLLSTQHDNPTLWLESLFQATLEASAVPELVINSRVSTISLFTCSAEY
jgi:FKBP12-rapamycin complex-associated protein